MYCYDLVQLWIERRNIYEVNFITSIHLLQCIPWIVPRGSMV